MKISLKIKIAFFMVLLVIVVMGTVTYIFTIRETEVRFKEVKLRIERLAHNIATIRSVKTDDWSVYQNYIDNQIKVNPDIVYIAIFNETQEIKAFVLNQEWVDVGQYRGLSRQTQLEIILKLVGREVSLESQKDLKSQSVNIYQENRNLGVVDVGFSLVDLNDELRSNLLRNFTLAILFILLAMFLAYFISLKIVKPLRELNQAMVQITKDRFDQEIDISSRDEIGEMANTFNYMVKGLKEKATIESFSHNLSLLIDLESINCFITERIVQTFDAKRGYLFIRDQKNPSYFLLAASFPKDKEENFILRCTGPLCDQFIKHREPRGIEDFQKYDQFIQEIHPFAQEIPLLVTPIVIHEEVIGLLFLGPRESSEVYLDDEKRFLTILIRQAGLSIEAGLLFEELTEQERLKRELEIASQVQQSLLPKSAPYMEGLDIHGICIPTTEVGGDYFDFFKINHHTLGVVIGDVAGKGTSAAFYMAVVKGLMLSLSVTESSPRQLLSLLNRKLYRNTNRKTFVTMIYGIIDARDNTIVFSRAGHNALIIGRNGLKKAESITPKGIGLGLEKGEIFDKTIDEMKISLGPGDSLIFYTDGISEAMNREKEMFGEDQVLKLFDDCEGMSASGLCDKIIGTLKKFTKDAIQHDDMTIVAVKII